MRNIIRRFTIAAGLLMAAASACAVGAVSFEREVTIDSAPDTVWKFVGDFNSLDVWHPSVLRSTIEGKNKPTAAGAIRVLKLVGGGELVEKLVKYNAAQKSYTYAGVKGPLPVKNYLSTIALTPAPDGKTIMKWSATFDPNGMDEDIVTEIVSIAFDGGLDKVVTNFKR